MNFTNLLTLHRGELKAYPHLNEMSVCGEDIGNAECSHYRHGSKIGKRDPWLILKP